MNEQMTLRDRHVVLEALDHNGLIPPSAQPSLGTGSVAKLRDSMARFSTGSLHQDRRRSVESAITRIDLPKLANTTALETAKFLTGPEVGTPLLAAVVPTRAMGLSLGVAYADLQSAAIDVELITRPIGRGLEADAEADGASDRLLERFANHPDGAVAAVSLLYQNRDATEALLNASIPAAGCEAVRPPAVSGTVRQAACPVSIGSFELEQGDLIRLEFVAADMEFGAGVHRCPGVELTRTIVEAMMQVILDEEDLG